MAKTIRYPNGLILKGVHSRVALLRGVKRNTAGTVSMVNAPGGATKATTGLAAAGGTTKTLTVGLTGTPGVRGRNWIQGKFIVIGTAATKNKVWASLKTINGATKALGNASAAAATVTKTVAINTSALKWGAPGVITLKATCTPTAKLISTLKFSVLKVNDLTSQMM